MAEGDVTGTASVEIEAFVVVNEQSIADASAKIAEGVNADVSTPEGRRSRGRTSSGAPATADVDAKVKTKVEKNIGRDIQAEIDKTDYQLTIDTLNIREQITQALKAPFDITVNAEINGAAAAHERIGTAHGAATATGAASSQAPIPQEITTLLRENKGALATNINNLYRNINEAFAAAGKGRFGRQSVEGTGSEVQKLGEIMLQFGSTFGELATLTKTNKVTGGSLSPKELAATLGLKPDNPAIQTVAQAGVPGLLGAAGSGGDPARKIGVLMSRVATLLATPVAAPAAAAESTIPVHEQRAMDTTARVESEKQRADAKQAIIAERQASLRITALSSAGFPSAAYTGRQTRRPPNSSFIGPTLPGNQYPETPATGQDPEAEQRARYGLGGRERANVRRLRGRGTGVSFGNQQVDLESYLRAAEMGQFQDVYEQFGGKGGRDSQGLRRFEAQDVGGFDELSRLGRRKPGVKFGVAGQQGRFARVGPQEALIRTIIADLGIGEDSASAEQVRASLEPQMETIRKAVGAGAKPLQGTSGATKRGQGSVSIEGASDLGAESKRLFEFIDFLDGKIKSYAGQLDRVNTDIEKMSGSGQDVSGLESQATGLAKEIQRFRGLRSDAQRQRDVLGQEPDPRNREASRLQAERSRAGVAAGIGFTDAEKLDRQLQSPGAQGRYGAQLMGEMGLEDAPSTIRNALLQKYLGAPERAEGRTGRYTMRQAAFGPRGRASRNPGADEGVFGELVSAIPADMGPDARKTLVGVIRDLLTSTLEDEGFKRDVAEQTIARKEGATLRPALTGVTGEGLYTKTPPGIMGSLRARIEGEERLGPGHTKEAHGDPEAHEELEDTTAYGVGVAGRKDQPRDPTAPGGATVIPGLRSQLRALEERDAIIAAEEEKAARTRNASIARSTGLSGDETTAEARASGMTMEPEPNAPPWAAFAARYAAGGAGAGGTGGGGGGFDASRLFSGGGNIPVDVMNWPQGLGGGGGGGGGGGRGRVTAEGGEEPEEEGPIEAAMGRAGIQRKRLRFRRPTGQTITAAERYRAQQEKMYSGLFDQQDRDADQAETNRRRAVQGLNKAVVPPTPRRERQETYERLFARRDREDAEAARRARGPGGSIGTPSRERAQAEAERAGVALNLPEPGVSSLLTAPPTAAVLRANAARQRAQRSLPQRAISTSFVQIAENLFGGLDAPQQRLATLANRTQDVNALATQQAGLRQQRRARLSEIRLLGRGAEATEAAGGDATQQRARVKGLTEEFLTLTKTSKQVNSALITGAKEVENLAASAVTATDVVRNLAAGAVGGVAGGLAAGGIAQATQAVVQISGQVLGPIIERLSNFAGTTGRVQEGLASSLLANGGLLRPTLGQQQAQARLSDAQAAAISGPLGQRAQTIAGTQSLQAQQDLFRTANNIGRDPYDRALTRPTGGLFDVQLNAARNPLFADLSIGGQASTAETLASSLRDLTSVGDIIKAGTVNPTIGDRPAGLPIQIGDSMEQRQKVADDAANKLRDENNHQLSLLNENLKSSKFQLVGGQTDKVALQAQEDRFAAVGARSLGEVLKDQGIKVEGLDANTDPREFLKAYNEGPKLSPQALLDMQEPQRRAQIQLEDMQRQLQIATVNPQTTAIANAAQPLGPAAAGIDTTGLTKAQAADVNSELAKTQVLYDQINQDTEDGVKAAKEFVATTFSYDPKVGEQFAASLDHVAEIGKQITSIEVGLQTKQAAYSAAQFSFQIDLAKRSLSDAKGLVSGLGSGLGAVERQMYNLNRESQSLSLGMTQRQINFQRAVAGFQSPGLTSEEREARKEQAQTEAEYAQKQLNIQKQLFSLGGRQFTIQASRSVRDLTRQLGLLERGRVLSVETAAAEKKIIALTKIQAKENKQVETFYNSAVQRTGDIQTSMANLVASTEAALYDVVSSVLNAYQDTFDGMTAINAGRDLSRGTGTHQGRALGFLGGYHAAGFAGTVEGATSLGPYGVAGEAGGEAVAIVRSPHKITPSGSGSASQTFIVNINNPVVRSDDDKRKLISDVKRALQTEARLLLPQRA